MSGFVGLFIKYTKNMRYMHPVNTKGTDCDRCIASTTGLYDNHVYVCDKSRNTGDILEFIAI